MVFTSQHVSCCWNLTCRVHPPVSQHLLGRESGLLSRRWCFKGILLNHFFPGDIDNHRFLQKVFQRRWVFTWVDVDSDVLITDLWPPPPGGLWASRMLLEPCGRAQHPLVFLPQEPRLHSGKQQQAQRLWWVSPLEPVFDSSHSFVVRSFKQGSKEKISKAFFFCLWLRGAFVRYRFYANDPYLKLRSEYLPVWISTFVPLIDFMQRA